METLYVAVALATALANAASGTVSVVRPTAVLPVLRQGMQTVQVPESWLVFPIGVLKLAGAAGLAAGLLGLPYVDLAAATGLVAFWLCAVAFHVRVSDRSPAFFLACGFLTLALGTAVLGVRAW